MTKLNFDADIHIRVFNETKIRLEKLAEAEGMVFADFMRQTLKKIIIKEEKRLKALSPKADPSGSENGERSA